MGFRKDAMQSKSDLSRQRDDIAGTTLKSMTDQGTVTNATKLFEHFPAAFHHADRSAVRYQKRYRRMILVVAAVSAASCLAEFIPFLRARVFVVVLLMSSQLCWIAFNSHLGWNQKWYQSRALAESVKTLTWRFVVCGAPFGAEKSLEQARIELSRSVTETMRAIKADEVLDPRELPITEDMSELERVRGLSLDLRQRLYLDNRLRDQEVWYAKKARELENRRRFINSCGTLSSLAALLLAMVLVASPSLFRISIVSFFASITLGSLAIGQSLNLATDIRAYQVTHYEIKSILGQELPSSDSEWAMWVDDSEEALSREHVMWLASRSTVKKVR